MNKIIEEYKKVLAERIALDPADDYGADLVWKKAVAILSMDIDATINYIKNECSFEDFEWMSEIFDDLWDAFKKQGVQNKFAIAVDEANNKFVSQGYNDLKEFVPYIETEKH